MVIQVARATLTNISYFVISTKQQQQKITIYFWYSPTFVHSFIHFTELPLLHFFSLLSLTGDIKEFLDLVNITKILDGEGGYPQMTWIIFHLK